MATTQVVKAVSGSSAYYILRRKSDFYVWNGSAFAAWSDGSIASYDNAGAGVFDDKGGDLWLATLPSAAVTAAGNATLLLIPCYYATPGTPATSDTSLPAYEVNLSGAATASPGGNYITIGNAVDILQRSARAAGGLADDNSGRYLLADFHVALQIAFRSFIRQTRCTRTFSTVDIAEDDTSADFSGITGFHPDRLLRLYINDEDPISIGAIEAVIELRKCNPCSGAPTVVAFSNFTTLQLWETSDDDYELNAEWWPDLVAFTAGDTGVSATLINVPADLATEVAATGAVACLQYGSIENAPVADRGRAGFEKLVDRSRGAGGTGAKVVYRSSLRSTRVRRW